MESVANIDGFVSKAEEAKISILDRGFLYGDSVYEVFRTYKGVPFLFTQHMDRLDNSAKLAQMHISQSREFLLQEIKKTVQIFCKKQKGEIYIRLTITRGTGPIDLNPNTASQTSYIILIKEVPSWSKHFYTAGVKLAIPQIRRNSIQSLEPNIKGGNYLNNVLAVGQARKLSADDALLCNLDGYLTEASNSNVLFVEKEAVVTPDLSSGNLNGTTKLTLQTICQKNNIPFIEKKIKPSDLQKTSECFIASATREIMPVQSIRLEDSSLINFPQGGGNLTKKLHALYLSFVNKYLENHKQEALF